MSEGYVDPTRETFGAFRRLAEEGPIHMLNLVRLRDKAVYPDGRAATGAEAYAAYGRESGPIFSGLGGRIVWRGSFRTVLIGPMGEHWDEVFVAAYPAASVFIEMLMTPAYQQAVVHRQAAVLTSRLIRPAPAEAGDGFAFA